MAGNTKLKQRICAIIPAFNEEKTVGDVISAIQQQAPHVDIVVMNDGSRDTTSKVAGAHGATVLDLPINLGIGGAVQTGLKHAERQGYDVAVEIDADGQHGPQHLLQLVQALAEHEADLVIGSRFIASTDYRSSVMRRFGIHTFSYLIRRASGKRIYDSTSGFRAYGREAIDYFSHNYPADFPEPESIVMALAKGMNIVEVPVEMNERQAGESVVRRDISLRALYFVVSNAIAIVMTRARKGASV